MCELGVSGAGLSEAFEELRLCMLSLWLRPPCVGSLPPRPESPASGTDTATATIAAVYSVFCHALNPIEPGRQRGANSFEREALLDLRSSSTSAHIESKKHTVSRSSEISCHIQPCRLARSIPASCPNWVVRYGPGSSAATAWLAHLAQMRRVQLTAPNDCSGSINSTRLLCPAMKMMQSPPRLLYSAHTRTFSRQSFSYARTRETPGKSLVGY